MKRKTEKVIQSQSNFQQSKSLSLQSKITIHCPLTPEMIPLLYGISSNISTLMIFPIKAKISSPANRNILLLNALL